MRSVTSNKSRGFTIVELLIVIVVIAILAAITIVAYNGVQGRSTFSRVQSELASINKALKMYHAENGSYPVTGTASAVNWQYSCSTGITNFISGINQYAILPQAPCKGSNPSTDDTWLYGSDGVGYKLLHLRPASAIASFVPTSMREFRYSVAQPTYGYWTSDWQGV